MAFGHSIRRLRLKSGLSAERLAQMIGIESARLRKWEERDSVPREADSQKIETFFGLSLDEIAKLKEMPRDIVTGARVLEIRAVAESANDNGAIHAESVTAKERSVQLRLSLKHNRKPIPVTNGKAAAGTITFINDEPELILEYIDAPFIGQVEGVVEVVGDSMYPTFKNGTRIAVTRLTDPQLLYWGEYYYIIDKNWQGVVKRVYEGDSVDYIVLSSDNPDRVKYPVIKRRWDQIEAVFKVKADITKH